MGFNPISILAENAYLFTALYLLENLLWYRLYLLHKRSQGGASAPVLGYAFIFLAIGFLSPPLFENDLNRYQFDGWQVSRGNNPYLQAPEEVAPARVDLTSQLDYKSSKSIYAPLTQIFFGGVALLSGGNSRNFRIILVFLMLIYFSVSGYRYYMQLTSDSRRLVLLLMIHPLVLKEVINSGHFDLLFAGTLLSLLSVKANSAKIGLGAALAMIRPVGLAILPLFVMGLNRRAAKWAAAFIALVIVWTLAQFNYFENLLAFARIWEMNSGVFRWLREAMAFFGWSAYSRWVMLLIMSSVLLVVGLRPHFSRQEKVFWILFLIPLLSPICNPWYFIWSLFLVPVLPRWQQENVLLALMVLPLSYLFYTESSNVFILAWNAEHIVIWLLVFRAFSGGGKENSFVPKRPVGSY